MWPSGEPVHYGPLVAKDGKCQCVNGKELKDVVPMMLGSHVGSLQWRIQWWAFGQRHEIELGWGRGNSSLELMRLERIYLKKLRII